MQVKFKKLAHTAIIPQYAKVGDAGLDLVATSIPTNTSSQVVYGTGLAVEIPEGYVGLLFPRSSIRNYELSLANAVGVIDSGYRGEIQATFNKLNGLTSFQYKVGDKVCQLLIVPYPNIEPVESAELSSTERGIAGFGSTGT